MLVKVVAIFGVINRLPAKTPAPNVFCFCAVALIQTSSVNLVFKPKSGFKKICRAQSGFRLENEAFCNSLRLCRQGPTRGDWKDTSSTHQVDYANFRPNVFAAGERISMEILVGVGLHAWCPVALKTFAAFAKNGNVQQKCLSSL